MCCQLRSFVVRFVLQYGGLAVPGLVVMTYLANTKHVALRKGGCVAVQVVRRLLYSVLCLFSQHQIGSHCIGLRWSLTRPRALLLGLLFWYWDYWDGGEIVVCYACRLQAGQWRDKMAPAAMVILWMAQWWRHCADWGRHCADWGRRLRYFV